VWAYKQMKKERIRWIRKRMKKEKNTKSQNETPENTLHFKMHKDYGMLLKTCLP
jgi:hypothetical protein